MGMAGSGMRVHGDGWYSDMRAHCKKHGVTEHPWGAIFYCFRGNTMG